MGFPVSGSVGGLVSGASVGLAGDVGLGSVGGCGGASCVGWVDSSANGTCVSVDGFAGVASSPISVPSVSCENVDAAEASYTGSRMTCSVSAHTIMCVSSTAGVTVVLGSVSEDWLITAFGEHPARSSAATMEIVTAVHGLMY